MKDKIKEFFKNNWGVFIAGLIIVLGLSFYRRKVDTYENIVRSLQESHQKELVEIKNAREEERKSYEENERRYKEKMEIIEKEYDKARIALEVKKQTDAKKIITITGGKPDKLAEKLAEVTGFKIIMPQD